MKLSMMTLGTVGVVTLSSMLAACAAEPEQEELGSAEGAWIFDGKPRDAEYRLECKAKCDALGETDDAHMAAFTAKSPTAFSSGECTCKFEKDAPKTQGVCRFSNAIADSCRVSRGRPAEASTVDEETCTAVCNPM